MNKLPSISSLRKIYVGQEQPLPKDVESLLRLDTRKGAKQILDCIYKKHEKELKENKRLKEISIYERRYWEKNITLIAGIDEVGCAPLAGPVLAAAVILPKNCLIKRVDDSKKLTARLRSELAEEIKEKCISWGIGMASPEEIDQLNIYHADLLAMQRAINNLSIEPQLLLIDGRQLKTTSIEQLKIIQGDQKSISIAAASIVAKVTRDSLMIEYDQMYPGYGFSRNKGYGTKEHQEALWKLGITPIHRRSWKTVHDVIEKANRGE